jgi:hypothetical protein
MGGAPRPPPFPSARTIGASGRSAVHWTAFSFFERGVVLDCYSEKNAISITIHFLAFHLASSMGGSSRI